MKKWGSSKKEAYISLFFLMFIILVCIVGWYVFVEQKDKSFTNTSMRMNVQVHQMLFGNDAELAAERVREKLQEVENKISYDIAESDIEKINNGAGKKWIKASEETILSLDKFIDISKKSKRAIDPTVLPLIAVWGFDGAAARYPEKAELEKALSNIDYRDIKINHEVERVKIRNKDGSITLKQIEKGIACNAAIGIYKNLKIDYGVVSIGGVVGVYGQKPSDSLWKVAIKNPFTWADMDSRIAHIKVKDGYVATFGLESDKINIGGSQKNRLLNIKTGQPVENNIASVSVLHTDAIIADALAKVCCALGKDESLDVLNYYGAEAIFVYEDKKIYVTPKIRENFSITDTDYTLMQA